MGLRPDQVRVLVIGTPWHIELNSHREWDCDCLAHNTSFLVLSFIELNSHREWDCDNFPLPDQRTKRSLSIELNSHREWDCDFPVFMSSRIVLVDILN